MNTAIASASSVPSLPVPLATSTTTSTNHEPRLLPHHDQPFGLEVQRNCHCLQAGGYHTPIPTVTANHLGEKARTTATDRLRRKGATQLGGVLAVAGTQPHKPDDPKRICEIVDFSLPPHILLLSLAILLRVHPDSSPRRIKRSARVDLAVSSLCVAVTCETSVYQP